MDPRQAALHELKTLVLSFHSVVAIETPEEERVQSLLRAVGVDLFLPLHEWSVVSGLRNSANRDGISGSDDPLKLLKGLRAHDNSAIFLLCDFAKHLTDNKVNRQFREVAQHFARTRSTIVLCGDPIEVPPDLLHLVARFELPLPTRDELRDVVKQTIDTISRSVKVQVTLDGAQTETLLRILAGMTLAQARQAVAYAVITDNKLTVDDLKDLLKRKGQLIRGSGVLEFVPVEANTAELGGFAGLKSWLRRVAVGFTSEARAMNLAAPRGALIVGVQGCGKSLAAKAVAREWNMPLLKFDAGKMYDKFIGESERNLRKAIAVAESIAPAVLWIDEIEKALGPTGSGESDGGLGRRLFGSFLTWLQENRRDVFVVATANDISALPPELLRKGRFDEIFFVDLPDDGERRDIFAIHLRLRRQVAEQFHLDALVERSRGYSGAEIEQVVVSSLYRALHMDRPLDDELLQAELRYIIPLSISRREDVERLRALAQDRFVSVR
ncbi:MAG: AAA family ATPase [Planctomycetes bacterium]|nr:AAA family ATPase [Planctomycetota bacterium]